MDALSRLLALALLSVGGCSLYSDELLSEAGGQSSLAGAGDFGFITSVPGEPPSTGGGSVGESSGGAPVASGGVTWGSGGGGSGGDSPTPSGGATPGSGGSIEPDQLRVMSFNVRNGTADDGPDAWEHRWEQATSIVEDYLPDVVGLQEVVEFQRVAFDEQTEDTGADYRLYGIPRQPGDDQEQNPLLYRADKMKLLESGTFWLSETPETPASQDWGASLPRICSWARFELTASGRQFYVYNTHLDHESSWARDESVSLILERIASRGDLSAPVLLTGDFNSAETSAPIATVGSMMVDTFRHVEDTATEVGTFHGFEGEPGTGDQRIDYIFADDSWTVTDAAILRDNEDGRFPSDHFPALTDLMLD